MRGLFVRAACELVGVEYWVKLYRRIAFLVGCDASKHLYPETLKGRLFEVLRLWDQANKCMWWMPWRLQAMKGVVACEKLRGAGKRALIRRCPNGETHPSIDGFQFVKK